MRTVEMESFDALEFLRLAQFAKEIRVDDEQLPYLLDHELLSRHIRIHEFGMTVMDAELVRVARFVENESRTIVFVMEEYEQEKETLPFKFTKQTLLHNPPHSTGNCFQTVIASLLGKEIEDVPHFAEGMSFSKEDTRAEGVEFMRRVNEYLESINYRLFEIAYESDFEYVSTVLRNNQHVPLILSGMSARGTNHSVIWYKGNIYDPHPSNAGLIGPMNNGQWVVSVLVKIPGQYHV